jgi:hypothetical protein
MKSVAGCDQMRPSPHELTKDVWHMPQIDQLFGTTERTCTKVIVFPIIVGQDCVRHMDGGTEYGLVDQGIVAQWPERHLSRTENSKGKS